MAWYPKRVWSILLAVLKLSKMPGKKKKDPALLGLNNNSRGADAKI